MLSKLFIFLCRFAALKRLLWKSWYNFLARRYRAGDWTFMNYGYVPAPADPPLLLRSEDEPDRYCIQLYQHIASSACVEGKRVLEVGAGRGGGASYVRRYLLPQSVTGVDFSASAVAFCRTRHVMAGLIFEEGPAEALPFEDAGFDVVLNVESSHCYASMDAFLNEVRRVLRPDGVFLHADLRDASGLGVWKEQLKSSGMQVISEEDITANVLAALAADNDRKSALIRKYIPAPLHASFADFAGLRGSAVYEGFRAGRLTYRFFVLKR
jgi:SAM-dependent methyltransferase